MITASCTANDNIFTRELYQGEEIYFPHIPAARYLIDKYVSAYWKHDPDDLDYVYMELSLCRYLHCESDSTLFRQINIKWVARVLNVNPIRLFNDPNLPF